jgi:hypothetical protein
VKALNPSVSGVLYLNTLLDFPFYALHGQYLLEDVVAMDSVTKKPIQIRNDNGLEGIFVFGFDKAKGQQLYIDAVKNLTSTGLVDGFYGDKWSKCAQAKGNCTGDMCICNHECGSMSTAQGNAWNKGKAKVLEAVVAIVGDGPYFQNGGNYTGGDPTAAGEPLSSFSLASSLALTIIAQVSWEHSSKVLTTRRVLSTALPTLVS